MNLVSIKRFLKRVLGPSLAKPLIKLNRLIFPTRWSADELAYFELIATYVQEGATVIDIGANEGLWSIALSRKVGDTGKVIAFEPVEDTFTILSRNLKKHPNVAVHKVGLSAEAGTAEIWRDPITPAPPSATIQSTAKHIDSPSGLVAETIEINTLDELFLSAEEDISFMKIDVEGHEEMVIKGGMEMLKRNSPVIFMEILREYWKEGGIGKSGAASLLAQLGYEIAQVTPSGIIKNSDDFDSKYENFLFLPTT